MVQRSRYVDSPYHAARSSETQKRDRRGAVVRSLPPPIARNRVLHPQSNRLGAPRVQQDRPARSRRVPQEEPTTVVQSQLFRRVKTSRARKLALRNRLENLHVLV